MTVDRDLTKYTYFRGRVGLYAILKALDIGEGDEVALQAFTCLAVPEAVLAAGAKPLYIDLEPRQFNMSAGDLADKVTPKTKAVIAQHTYGIPADMDKITAIAEKANIPIIEDCCHTLSGSLHGKRLGTFGAASFYSFEWGKPLVIGLGGSVTVNDLNLIDHLEGEYKKLRSPSLVTQMKIRLQYLAFQTMYRPRYYWTIKETFQKLCAVGAAKSNYNVIDQSSVSDDFQLKMAPFLIRRLINKQKQRNRIALQSQTIARQYRSKINNKSIQHPVETADSETVYARYPLLVDGKEQLIRQARSANIEISDWYSTPIHPLGKDSWPLVQYREGMCPNTEKTCGEVVTLPINHRVSKKDVERIADFLNSF